MILKKRKYFNVLWTAAFIVTGVFTAVAQHTTSSPYSRFGVGELLGQGTAYSKALGGTGIALRDKRYLNPMNPASFTTLDSTSFLFDVGLTGFLSHLKTSKASRLDKRLSFEYFMLGFSVKKWWGVSAGIRQLTDVGYNLDFAFDDENIGTYRTSYTGSGGINKVYLANSFNILPQLSLGVSINYNWGSIQTTKSVAFTGINRGIPYNSVENLKISNFDAELGIQWSGKINKSYDYIVGATFAKKTDLTGHYEHLEYRVHPEDIISYSELKEKAIELPNRFGIGIAVNKSNKLMWAIDATYQAWGGVNNVIQQNSSINIKMKDSYKITAGMEYTPNIFSARKFLQTVSYRGGVYYNHTNLEVKGNRLANMGLTLGFGIPIKSTYINLSLDLGTRGTISNGLVRENYARLNLSVTLYEQWFRKILYD